MIQPVPVLTAITVLPEIQSTGFKYKPKQFIAFPKDQFGNPMKVTVIWSVSDPNVGTIDNNGLFTANAPSGSVRDGRTTIIATSGNVSGTATAVTVSTGF